MNATGMESNAQGAPSALVFLADSCAAASWIDLLSLISAGEHVTEDLPMVEARRDPMAPDSEPTDEELSVVMREALDLALARKATSDEWMRRQLSEAVREALSRPRAPGSASEK